jgi:hypothetical protein
MKMQRVISSNIVAIGYDAGSELLQIEFKNGSVYQYHRVPSSIANGLLNAPSHGKYFARFIRNAGYRYIQIR